MATTTVVLASIIPSQPSDAVVVFYDYLRCDIIKRLLQVGILIFFNTVKSSAESSYLTLINSWYTVDEMKSTEDHCCLSPLSQVAVMWLELRDSRGFGGGVG